MIDASGRVSSGAGSPSIEGLPYLLLFNKSRPFSVLDHPMSGSAVHILSRLMKRPQTRPISEHLISIHSFRTSRFLNHGGDRLMFLRPAKGRYADMLKTRKNSRCQSTLF